MTSHVQGRDADADTDQPNEDPQGPGKRYSRIFGALFIAGFLACGIGFVAPVRATDALGALS